MIHTFGKENREMTLSQPAARPGLTRLAARRFQVRSQSVRGRQGKKQKCLSRSPHPSRIWRLSHTVYQLERPTPFDVSL
jgi:hypothetical protein